jgi:TRAP transporter TAXI family solute receptor
MTKSRLMQKLNSGYIPRTIPKGTYQGVDYDVHSFGFFTHLIISAKLPEELVYKITKTLVTNLPRYGDVVRDMKGATVKDLALDIGIPFHPGAIQYYREKGIKVQ